MSAEALDWVWGMYPVYQGRPDTLAKHMLLFAAVRADARGESFWGEESFRRELCAGRDAFRARKAFLVEAGYVVIETRRHTQGPRRGQRTSDLWKLQLANRLPDEPPSADQPEGFWAGPQIGWRSGESAGRAGVRTGSTPDGPEPTKPRSPRRRPDSGSPVEEEQEHKNQETRRTRVTSGDQRGAPLEHREEARTTARERPAGETPPEEMPHRVRRRPTRRTRADGADPAAADSPRLK